MAAERPTRLDQYCSAFNTSFFDLKIDCLFCNFALNLQELAAFYMKSLSLIWKGDTVYAICLRCTRVSARYEADKYFRCAVKSDYIENLTKTPLVQLSVRCLECYKLLDTAEKIDLRCRGEDICLIRKYWRAYCRDCVRK